MIGDTYTTGGGHDMQVPPSAWKPVPKGTYHVEVRLRRDGKTTIAYVPRLPGCASQGDTFVEALEHIKEALVGVIKSYCADGGKVPWRRREDTPLRELFEEVRYVTVYVPPHE